MEKEGLKPIKIGVFNSRTKNTEMIVLNTNEEALHLHDESL